MDNSHHFSPLQHSFTIHERNERRDAMEHRHRILEAARHLFAEHGVEAVSMHQIAKAAEVGQGTLYRRYANKGALCVDLMRDSHEHFAEEIATMLAAMENSTALKRLDVVLTVLVAFIEEQGALLETVTLYSMRNMHCSFMSKGNNHHEPLPHDPFYHWLNQLLSGLLTEAVERNELAPLDIAYTADAILATLHPGVYQFQRQERGYSPERILQGLRRIYIDGINNR
ncbi:MAG TPA: TetR/AcrR family transcriptional regulator [Ktedonobacter sp.]|nr:TetR/AcrR family transcriptional regulator [Ktedonobacter sp.]